MYTRVLRLQALPVLVGPQHTQGHPRGYPGMDRYDKLFGCQLSTPFCAGMFRTVVTERL